MREDLAVSMEFGVGSVLEGKVTGITKFGAFVSLPEGKSGLVHISEIAYSYVNDVKDHLKEGQEVKVKVIGIDENGRINLSIKKAMDPPPRPAGQGRPMGRPGGHTGGGFRGKPEHVEHFMLFVAEQLREVMASLGFRTVDEMVGHPECLRQIEVPGNRKANLLDLTPVLASATCEFGAHIPGADGRHFLPQMAADSELDKTLDSTLFVPYTADARAHLRPIRFRADIANVNRCVGTILGNAVTKAHPEGLPAGSITIDCDGSAGQSFGAFLPRGITLNVCGDANDYFGKGLSGGEVSVRPNPHATYKFDENIIVGNVAFFGATSGRGFINGLAGQRFGVRNSGATVVVEGCGNHGCEYMTGGLALILGEVGQNFAAGMTGGVAYVFDQYGTLDARVNHESVELKAPTAGELEQVRALIQEHVDATQSPRGIKLLYSFETMSKHFVKVIPTEYERVLAIVAAAEAVGKTHAQAEELAFDIVTGRASDADVARFDVAGGAAGAASVAASPAASTKKEA